MKSMPAPDGAGHRRGRHPPGHPRGRRHGPGRAAARHQAFPASTRGYVALVTWAERFGPVERIGVEGTGTYGAGLARSCRAYGLAVVEVNRPDRSIRRRQGKSDPSMPRPPPGRPWPGRHTPRPARARWR